VIFASCGPLELPEDSSARRGRVRCKVSYNGPGLADEVMFEPLTSTKATGMGIGLSMSKSIAETRRGRTRTESGATFNFIVPQATAEIEE